MSTLRRRFQASSPQNCPWLTWRDSVDPSCARVAWKIDGACYGSGVAFMIYAPCSRAWSEMTMSNEEGMSNETCFRRCVPFSPSNRFHREREHPEVQSVPQGPSQSMNNILWSPNRWWHGFQYHFWWGATLSIYLGITKESAIFCNVTISPESRPADFLPQGAPQP